jgi:hypothetical protein
MGMVFAKGEIELQGFMREFQYQIYWGARSNTQRNVYTDLMYQVLNGFANRNALSTADKFALATLTEKTLKE